MRQVPANFQAAAQAAHYLVIGDSRLARHLRTYLSLENLKYDSWSRRSAESLNALIERSTHVLLAISDAAIGTFIAEHPTVLSRSCVHFSGALVSSKVPSAHPLMTFSFSLYTLEDYRAIPFVFERGRGSMSALLPGLSNKAFEIEAEKKPLYHALCSMSGNFTVLLWEKVFASFERELRLPREILRPYLSQVAQNLIASSGTSVLTGPLARGDFATIERHLDALGADPYAQVYQAFVEAYSKRAEPMMFPLGGLV